MSSIYIIDNDTGLVSKNAKDRLKTTIKCLNNESKDLEVDQSKFVNDGFKLTIERKENDIYATITKDTDYMSKEDRRQMLKTKLRGLRDQRGNKSGRDVKTWRKVYGDEIVDDFVKAVQTTPNQQIMKVITPEEALGDKNDDTLKELEKYLQLKQMLGDQLTKSIPDYVKYNDKLCRKLGLDPDVKPIQGQEEKLQEAVKQLAQNPEEAVKQFVKNPEEAVKQFAQNPEEEIVEEQKIEEIVEE
jgi:hypothetical protein